MNRQNPERSKQFRNIGYGALAVGVGVIDTLTAVLNVQAIEQGRFYPGAYLFADGAIALANVALVLSYTKTKPRRRTTIVIGSDMNPKDIVDMQSRFGRGNGGDHRN